MDLRSTPARALLVIGSLFVFVAGPACSANSEAQHVGDDPLMAVEGGGGGGTPPPPPPPPTTYTGRQYASYIRQVATYVLGGGAPTKLCKDGTTVLSKAPNLTTLRDYISQGTCTLGKPSLTTACNVSVSAVPVDCPNLSDSQITTLTSINDGLNSCWPNPTAAYSNYYCSDATYKYPQSKDFWQVAGSQIVLTGCAPQPCTAAPTTYHLMMDPEPAVLNEPLGSSASATYTDSYTYTTAYQWPTSWAWANWIPVGKPSGYRTPAIFPELQTIEGDTMMFTLLGDLLQGKDVQASLQKVDASLKSIMKQ